MLTPGSRVSQLSSCTRLRRGLQPPLRLGALPSRGASGTGKAPPQEQLPALCHFPDP